MCLPHFCKMTGVIYYSKSIDKGKSIFIIDKTYYSKFVFKYLYYVVSWDSAIFFLFSVEQS